MKNEKIYSAVNGSPKSSLYYFLVLEDNDVVDENCYLKFANSWAPISKDSTWMGKTMTEVRSSLSALKIYSTNASIVAKRFLNA